MSLVDYLRKHRLLFILIVITVLDEIFLFTITKSESTLSLSDLEGSVDYRSLVSPSSIYSILCGGWVILIALGLAVAVSSVKSYQNQRLLGSILALIYVGLMLFPVYLLISPAFQDQSALKHLASASFNDKKYELALFESYPVWTTHWGVHLVFECDAEEQNCRQVQKLEGFPLGTYEITASLKISTDEKRLILQEANREIIVATRASG